MWGRAEGVGVTRPTGRGVSTEVRDQDPWGRGEG